MRNLWIIVLILGFAALTLWGVSAAAAGTHTVLGDAGYQPFLSIWGLNPF